MGGQGREMDGRVGRRWKEKAGDGQGCPDMAEEGREAWEGRRVDETRRQEKRR